MEKKDKVLWVCDYCSKEFSYKTNMYRHIRSSCKIKKLVDLKIKEVAGETPPKKQVKYVDAEDNYEDIQKLADVVRLIETQQNHISQQQVHIKQQNEQINALADLIKNKKPEIINNNTTNTVINNNIVYITDQLDYLEILEQRFGTRDKSIEFIKSKLHNKLQGEVDVFSEIHLQGPPHTWPIRCPDKSKKQFYLVQPDNSMVLDPGGVTTHKRFYRNLQTAVLKLINQELAKVVDHGVGSDEYEELRDSLLDDFDLQTFQTRALEMSSGKPGSFLKHLMDEMAQKESCLTLTNV